MSKILNGWQGGLSPEFRQALRGSDYVPGAWIDVVEGQYVVCEVVIDVEDNPEESAWLLVLAAERIASVLEHYGWCNFPAFTLKFKAAAELIAARPPKKRKTDSSLADYPF
jgi:hypothetical protein